MRVLTTFSFRNYVYLLYSWDSDFHKRADRQKEKIVLKKKEGKILNWDSPDSALLVLSYHHILLKLPSTGIQSSCTLLIVSTQLQNPSLFCSFICVKEKRTASFVFFFNHFPRDLFIIISVVSFKKKFFQFFFFKFKISE